MIIGHKKQRNFLKESARIGKLSHAYLFSGQGKLGKKTIALEWILSFFNEQKKESHPDLILVEAEKKEIQINQIRNLIRKLSLKPQAGSFKAAIIDNAHLMNQEAQTCILKTLEEPRGNTILILITEAPEILFPTILSRVQNIKFYPVEKEEIKNYLKGNGVLEKTIEEISQISLGRPGIALDFIKDVKKLDDFQKKIKELNEISKSEIAVRFQYAKNLSEDPQEIKDTLDAWLSYFRNALLSQIRESGELQKIKNILENIQKTNFLISASNVNSRLALELLMLEL